MYTCSANPEGVVEFTSTFEDGFSLYMSKEGKHKRTINRVIKAVNSFMYR